MIAPARMIVFEQRKIKLPFEWYKVHTHTNKHKTKKRDVHEQTKPDACWNTRCCMEPTLQKQNIKTSGRRWQRWRRRIKGRMFIDKEKQTKQTKTEHLTSVTWVYYKANKKKIKVTKVWCEVTGKWLTRWTRFCVFRW